MNRPMVRCIALITMPVLAACSSSESSVQTAIAETQQAQPSATPSETPVPLSQLNLENLLIQDGDLPPIFVGQQVVSRPPVDIGSVPPADLAINREFRAGEFGSDGVTILLYESLDDLERAYDIVAGVIAEKTPARPLSQVGEKAVVTERTIGESLLLLGMSSATSAKVVFIRCHAVVYIDLFASVADAEMAAEYARRIDQRLDPLVCN